MVNKLYEFNIEVLPGPKSALPENIKGGSVLCYAAAPDYQAAIKKGVTALANMHYIFKDIKGKVREIPISSWGEYVLKVWPELASHLPSQEKIFHIVERGEVFFGLFAGFDH